MEETRVTSSDFDKINVTDMHQVTMQEAVGEASYEDIPVEEVSSAATFKKPFERRESWQEEAALLTPQAEAIRIHKEDIPEHEETPAEPAENPVRPKITAPEPLRGIPWWKTRYIRILQRQPNSPRQNTGSLL